MKKLLVLGLSMVMAGAMFAPTTAKAQGNTEEVKIVQDQDFERYAYPPQIEGANFKLVDIESLDKEMREDIESNRQKNRAERDETFVCCDNYSLFYHNGLLYDLDYCFSSIHVDWDGSLRLYRPAQKGYAKKDFKTYDCRGTQVGYNHTSGMAVWAAQVFCNLVNGGTNISEDGYYGPATKGAIIRAQRKLREDADGIVGRATWKAMAQYVERNFG